MIVLYLSKGPLEKSCHVSLITVVSEHEASPCIWEVPPTFNECNQPLGCPVHSQIAPPAACALPSAFALTNHNKGFLTTAYLGVKTRLISTTEISSTSPLPGLCLLAQSLTTHVCIPDWRICMVGGVTAQPGWWVWGSHLCKRSRMVVLWSPCLQ